MNVYGIYITRSREEREYFKKLKIENRFAQIVHLDFKYNQVVKNMKYFRQKMIATVYSKSVYQTVIYNLDDLIALFTVSQNGKPNVFIYSGHGNGVMLMKKNIRPLRTEDFCEIISRTVKKADLVVYDCCLQGNIACLTITYPFAKYVIASTSYQSDISILIADNLYNFNGNILSYCKNVLHEIILKESDFNYITDFVLYEMNENVLKIAELTLKFKHLFDYHKSYVIDYSYYKDLNCSFKDIIDIEPLLNKIVKYQRYNQIKCINHKISRKVNKGFGSKLMIVVKNPIKNGLPTQSDKFYL